MVRKRKSKWYLADQSIMKRLMNVADKSSPDDVHTHDGKAKLLSHQSLPDWVNNKWSYKGLQSPKIACNYIVWFLLSTEKERCAALGT